MFGYDFRGHDFAVTPVMGNEFVYAVMNDHVFQYSIQTGRTYDLGGFKEEKKHWKFTERKYHIPGEKLNEGDDCNKLPGFAGRTSKEHVSYSQ